MEVQEMERILDFAHERVTVMMDELRVDDAEREAEQERLTLVDAGLYGEEPEEAMESRDEGPEPIRDGDRW